jgi:hypothetical protein
LKELKSPKSIGYIETVDKIARKDLSGEITQIQEWFREFHNRNGYFEAIVLGRMFGGDYLPICVEMKSGKMLQGNIVEAGDIESAWLVIPPLQMKIKCNGMLAGKMLGQGFLFSKWENTELRYLRSILIFIMMKKHRHLYCRKSAAV